MEEVKWTLIGLAPPLRAHNWNEGNKRELTVHFFYNIPTALLHTLPKDHKLIPSKYMKLSTYAFNIER